MTRTAVATAAVMAALLAPPGRAGEGDAAPADAWPMARGCLAGTGRSAGLLRLPLAEAWKRDFPETAFAAVPVVADGVLYMGDLDGTFRAIDLADGRTRWNRRIEGAGFPAAAAVAFDPALPVAVGDDTGVVRGLARADGEIRWEYATEGEISGGPTILADGGPPRLLVGSQDSSLSCLDLASGRLLWKHSIADQIRCSPTVARTPAGDRIFLAGCDGRLHVIDAANGAEVAAVEIGGPTGTTPAVGGKLVLFGTEGGTFFAIDHLAPAVAWRKEPAAGAPAYRASAAIVGELAIVGTRGRAVEAFALADGQRLWRKPMRGRVDASPVVVAAVDGAGPRPVAVVADAKGTITVLDAASGEPAWTFDAGGGFSGGPAVAAGRVVIASDDGSIWCFRSAD
ncbi:MAG: serine/threonine protein kinase [Planctomycetes bacterium]|nr:serine/threonine protein kinase [Planctomycetota bacterium]